MDLTVFLVYLAACCAAAATGSLFPPDKWYFEELKKPSWTPPPWLFPLAWSALYIASAIAAARVAGMEGAALATAFWALQIALNTLWSPVFFGLKRVGAAMVSLTALWLAVVATTLSFFALDPIAGFLMAPYVVWVTYAGALNWWIWRNNGATTAAGDTQNS
ncbi:MAG: TspO/MBR family protein [Pseudomonadota bacterium]